MLSSQLRLRQKSEVQPTSTLIPVPLHEVGLSSLKMFVRPDYREIAIVGSGLRVRLEGEPVPQKSPSPRGIEKRD
jgi:hypothetical protein